MTGSGGHFPRLNFERGSVAIVALARFVFVSPSFKRERQSSMSVREVGVGVCRALATAASVAAEVAGGDVGLDDQE